MEAALAASFPGGASIGRLEGSVLGTFELRDVVVRDARGRPAITARRVRLDLGYLALLRGTLELETLDVDDATVVIELRRGRGAIVTASHPGRGRVAALVSELVAEASRVGLGRDDLARLIRKGA